MSETLVNTIDGDKLYAERAVKDASGNSISETYATKSEIPVVDQAYDATSTNAQSGVAVAEALSNVPSSLSAGDGIDITSDVVSAKVDGSTISFNASGELQATVSGGVTDVTVDGTSVVNAQGVAEITMPTFTQVNSDWNASSGVAEILNKPANLVQDANYVHTDENFTSADKTKLSGIATGAEVNVQADWNESDSSSDAYIKNKPDLSIYAQSADLSTVAFTGAYSDLSGTPTINNVPAVGSTDDGKVLTASYSGGVGSYSWTTPGSGGGDIFPVEYGVTTYAQITDALAAGKFPVLKYVDSVINYTHIAVFSGITNLNLYRFTYTSYADSSSSEVLGIEEYTVNSSNTWHTYIITTSDFQADWNQTNSNLVGYIKNKPSLATVASTGAYSDLSGTPTIPTIGTITL